VVRLLVRDSLRPVIVGLLVGLVPAFWTGRALKGLLLGVSAWDPGAVAVALIVLIGSATLAAWWPARRAARVDPRDVLRQVS
jgi:ABC-type antimicrobial peptide transport system permease subunit